ncbi:DNA-processing protein DprA [Mycoplasmopsis iners]|uniref:DNA-processing protein DprA n=1 Tax=Mycoplasmopsis iners TaxID=76630 RepID=UPI0004965C29|nr:DNA-processing protein DprA [Mycoplasmopsis iners]
MNDLLIYFAFKYKGNNYEIQKALKNGELVNKEDILNKTIELEANGIKCLTIFDSEYPEDLKVYKYAPLVIFYKGNIELLNDEKICLTGDIDNYLTRTNINKSLPNLVKHKTLISTNFKTLDKYIIAEWKNKGGKIIYPLANGIGFNNEMPLNDNELYLSIYPPDTNPKLIRFKERNLLVAMLAKFLVIYGSKQNSGIINLAINFANVGKEVYCYPGQNNEDGNTFLIKSGANLITHVADIYYF